MHILIINAFAGYGDTLSVTPTIHWLAQQKHIVDVYSGTIEPLVGNPDIRKLVSAEFIEKTSLMKHYDQVLDTRYILDRIPYAIMHHVDYMSLALIQRILPSQNKSFVYNINYGNISPEIYKIFSKKDITRKYVTVNPSTTWKSRTLPKEYYKFIIETILMDGDIPIIIGKSINGTSYGSKIQGEDKGLYNLTDICDPITVIDLTNKTTFNELVYIISQADLSINTENGVLYSHGISASPWQIYIPSLLPPEMILPYRQGTQLHKTIIWETEHSYPILQHNCQNDITNLIPEYPVIDTFVDIYKAYKEKTRS